MNLNLNLNFAKSLINNLSFELNIVLDPTEQDYIRVEKILNFFPETDETLFLLCHQIKQKRDLRKTGGVPQGWTPIHDKLYHAISKIPILTQITHPGQRGGNCCSGRI